MWLQAHYNLKVISVMFGALKTRGSRTTLGGRWQSWSLTTPGPNGSYGLKMVLNLMDMLGITTYVAGSWDYGPNMIFEVEAHGLQPRAKNVLYSYWTEPRWVLGDSINYED